MNPLTKIINWLNDYFSADEKEKIEQLELQLKALKNQLNSEEQHTLQLSKELIVQDKLIAELNASLIKNNKHSTLKTFKNWMDKSISPNARYYDWGDGRKRVHVYFKDCLEHKDLILDFLKKDLEFDFLKYNDVERLVFDFSNEMSKKYPTNRYYSSDQPLYGVTDKWATPDLTIEKLRKKKKAFDCDDVMGLKYACLYTMIEIMFPENLWRLRGFIVDLWTAGGHALLGWVKSGVNDWIPIETTFYDVKNHKIWKEEYRIRNQMLYQIRYSFDNKNEYTKI